MYVKQLSATSYQELAQSMRISLPIEQTVKWAYYTKTIPGRTPWGFFCIEENEEPVALLALTDYLTHGYHYLRAHHGPSWCVVPTPQQEEDALKAIALFARQHHWNHVFIRLAVKSDLPSCSYVLSSIPYDTTVVVDLSGTDEDILARMKTRGRRDVRKALREAPITCAVETQKAIQSFAEYYPVMIETAQRDGFSPAPEQEYHDFISLLGKEHCMVSVGRDSDGQVVNWAIDTISSNKAVHYFAASSTRTMKQYVTDRLYYFCFCELAKRGCTSVDLMGIGSEFSPSLNSLNTFKTKFAKDVTPIAPDRDYPLRPIAYKLLQGAKSVRRLVKKH
ncbi:peptidoglycan bridge formation glycyltransferase FemA/FemB family protein [uncultured Olegusella sp.]|uniref:lipid II:glycine glycyltransferase FemX n=1 Tax=uncultured Olegusella sp. TaxID=1979846 RepID=UPI002607C1F3|nr:peptidoglycan bridge formation glycyltransferase FemA/FemB family protein [uncultured Olegusella sp.]